MPQLSSSQASSRDKLFERPGTDSDRPRTDFLRRVTRAEHEPCYLRTCRVISLTNNGSDTKPGSPRGSRATLAFLFLVCFLFSFALLCCLSPSVSLSFSLVLSSACLPVETATFHFTTPLCELRANGRGSSREKWTRGCLMAPRRCRYRFIRVDVDYDDIVLHERAVHHRGHRDAIERNVCDVRYLYFPVRRVVCFSLAFSFLLYLYLRKKRKIVLFCMHEIRTSLPAKF